jgi:hypothetical protein
MNKNLEITRLERVRKLSGHLQRDMLQLSGKLRGKPPTFKMSLLIPIAVLVGAGAVLVFSSKARNSMLLKTAVLVSSRLLRKEVADEEPEV